MRIGKRQLDEEAISGEKINREVNRNSALADFACASRTDDLRSAPRKRDFDRNVDRKARILASNALLDRFWTRTGIASHI